MADGKTFSVYNLIRKHWPCAAAVSVLWVALGMLTLLALHRTAGHFTYTLDDPYIHAAMAKNFVRHGVWGITAQSFSSSSSSPLWTLLVALGFFVFGVHDSLLFWLNALFASLTLGVAYRLLIRQAVAPIGTFLTLLALILLVPLPHIVFIGMEHTLQVLLTLCLASVVVDAERDRPYHRALLLLPALLVGVRYEGLFVVLPAIGLLLWQRQWGNGFRLVCSALAPILLYGLISTHYGWFWLPNSILVKSLILPDAYGAQQIAWLTRAYFRASHHPYFLLLALLLVACLLLCCWNGTNLTTHSHRWIALFLGTAWLHLEFVNSFAFHWDYRYQAYLVALGIVAAAVTLSDTFSRETAFRERLWIIPAASFLHRTLFLILLIIGLLLLDIWQVSSAILWGYGPYLTIFGPPLLAAGLYSAKVHAGDGRSQTSQRIRVQRLGSGICAAAVIASAFGLVSHPPLAVAAIVGASVFALRIIQDHPAHVNLAQAVNYATLLTLTFIGLLSFGYRSYSAFTMIPQASENIYEQQIQMGQFLHRFYNGQNVALNDIGATSFLSDIRCFDLVGLGSLDVANRQLSHTLDRQAVAELTRAHACRIAIIYDAWFQGVRPLEWVCVGQWTIPNNVVTGGETVSFYAVAPDEVASLAAHLRQFAVRLPSSVKPSGLFCERTARTNAAGALHGAPAR